MDVLTFAIPFVFVLDFGFMWACFECFDEPLNFLFFCFVFDVTLGIVDFFY